MLQKIIKISTLSEPTIISFIYINNNTVNACKINLFEGEDNKFVSEKKPTRKIRNKIDLDIKSKDYQEI